MNPYNIISRIFPAVAVIVSSILLSACSSNETPGNDNDTITTTVPSNEETLTTPGPDTVVVDKPTPATSKTYANKRFRNVRVERTGTNQYRVTGQGQIFEATFSWIVEDGHNELAGGFVMTDAGAPEWGNFDFTLEVAKDRPNSTLHLVLFESSAKDGSRQYELPIPLP